MLSGLRLVGVVVGKVMVTLGGPLIVLDASAAVSD